PVPKPVPRPPSITPEEKEFEAEPPIPQPAPKPPAAKEEEFEPEDYDSGPGLRFGRFPAEKHEFDREQPPQAAGQDELEFMPAGPSPFTDFESETPRWRSWARAGLVVILILVAAGVTFQFLRGSDIPKSLAGLLSSLGISKPQSVLNSTELGLGVALKGD